LCLYVFHAALFFISFSNVLLHFFSFEMQIKPLSGPIEGGTLVTIEGSNLGLKEEDVKGRIRIGDIPCELVDYQVSVKIICRTGAAAAEIEAPVIIGNTAGYTESTVKYSYKVSSEASLCA
jgi:hypothetical protein